MIPEEILLYICSYLDNLTLLDLRKVSRYFESILSNEQFWKKRARRDYYGSTILFPDTEQNHSEKPWSQLINEVETNKKFFRDIENNKIQPLYINDILEGRVSQLKLMGDNHICLSVSDNQCISLWNVAYSSNNLIKQYCDAHNSFISCLDTCGTEKFCTGSTDMTVKVWSLENFSPVLTYQNSEYVSSISCKDSLIAVGLSGQCCSLKFIDTRVQRSPSAHVLFKGECTSIEAVTLEDNNNFVYVGTENKITTFDRRSFKELNSLTLNSDNSEASLLSYSYRNGTIVVITSEPVIDNIHKLTMILIRDMNRLTSTILPCNMYTKNICIKQNNYDLFYLDDDSLSCFLKSDPVECVDIYELPHKFEPDAHEYVCAIEYDPDSALILGSHDHIIIYKR